MWASRLITMMMRRNYRAVKGKRKRVFIVVIILAFLSDRKQ